MHLLNIKRIAFHVRDADTAFESEEAKALHTGHPLTSISPALVRAPITVACKVSRSGGSNITDAVNRYLSERGIASAGGSIASTSSATKSVTQSNSVAVVVDKFLTRRGSRSTATVLSNSVPAEAPKMKDLTPPAPPLDVVDFVCEDDVRQAMVLQTKLYINRKTIVTPAASDLNHSANVLVLTE